MPLGTPPTGKFKILVVQNTDLLIIILPKINFGPAQNTKLHVSLLCQVVQNTYKKVKKTEARRRVVGFEDLNIDVFLEVQNKRCS